MRFPGLAQPGTLDHPSERHLRIWRWGALLIASAWVFSGYADAVAARELVYALLLVGWLYNLARGFHQPLALTGPALYTAENLWLLITTALTGGLRNPLMIAFVMAVDAVVCRAGTVAGLVYGAAVTTILGLASWATVFDHRAGVALVYGVAYAAVFALVALYVSSRRAGEMAATAVEIEAGDLDLTPRQLEIMYLIAEGKRDHEICDQLCISASTLKTHRANLFRKLGARNRVEAVRKAQALGILPSPRVHRGRPSRR